MGKSLGPGASHFIFVYSMASHCFCCAQLSGNPIAGALSCRGPRTVAGESPRALRFAQRDPGPPALSSLHRFTRSPNPYQVLPRARQRHVLLPGGITVKPESSWTSAAAGEEGGAAGDRCTVHRAFAQELLIVQTGQQGAVNSPCA